MAHGNSVKKELLRKKHIMIRLNEQEYRMVERLQKIYGKPTAPELFRHLLDIALNRTK